MRENVRLYRGSVALITGLVLVAVRSVQAASGTWSGAANAVWANDANWSATPYPSGADVATFNSTGNGNTTIDLAGLSSIKTVVIDSASAAPYSLGLGGLNGQTLVLENSGLISVTNGVVNAQRVDASVRLGTTTAAGTYTVMNASVGSTLTLAGNVSGAPSGGTPGIKTFVVAGAGDTILSGALSDGGASRVNLTTTSTGVFTLSGVSTFSGPVAINGAGTLSVSKIGSRYSTDSNLGSGTNVSFGANNAKLRYTGAGETSDRLFTVTGGTPLTIEQAGTGPLLLTGDFLTTTTSGVDRELVLQGDGSVGEFAGVFSDYSEARKNKLTKKGTGTWTLSGDNLFKGAVTISDGILRLTPGGTLGAGPKSLTIVGNTTTLRPSLQLAGADGSVVVPAEITLRTSNKQTGAILNESGTNTIQGRIEMTSGDNFTHIWSHGGKLVLSGLMTAISSDRALYLRGDGDGEVSGVIENGSTVNLPVYKDVGSGTWTLTAANTYSGATTVGSGTLALSGADGSISASSGITVTNGAILRLDSRADANNGDRLKDTATVTLNNGSLVFANSGGAADYSETAGALSISGTGSTLSASQAGEGYTSTLTFASLARVGSATLSVTGEGLGESDRNRIFITGVPNGTVFTWISINGSPVSGYDSVRGLYAIAIADTDIAAYGDTLVSNDVSNVRINSEGTTGPIALSDPVTVIRSLAQNTGFDATVDTAGKTLRAETFLINEGKAGLTLGASPNDGVVAASVVGGSLAFFNYGSNALTVNASVADNGASSSLAKSGTGDLILAGTNTFSGSISVANGALILAGTPALPGAAGAALKLGSGTSVTRLSYLGGGETIGRAIDLAGTTAGTTLEQSGSGLLRFTGDLTYSGLGNKTLALDGSTAGIGELAGVFANGPGYTNKLTKSGSGTWILSNANTYSGDTEIYDGKLVLAHPNALAGSARVNFLSHAPDGFLEFANDGVNETLYNMVVGIGYNGTLVSGVASGDAGINHLVGDLSLSGMILSVARASNVVSGSPSIAARSVNLSGGGAHTSTLNPTTADLILGNVSMLSNPFSKTLKLDGTSEGNRVEGVIDNGVHTISVIKSNASIWELTGANTYTGATSVTGGTLTLCGANGAIGASRSVTLSGNGSLVFQNSAAANNTDRLGNAIPVTLNGGTLRFAHSGGAADYSETSGPLTVASGGNTIDASQADVGQTSAVTFASLVRTAGSVDFSGADLGADARNQVRFAEEPALTGGLIGPWATVNGSLATYGAFGVTAYTNYTDLSAKGPSILPDDAAVDARINSEGATGGITLEGAETNRIHTLSQNTAFPAIVGTASKVLLASGLLVADGKASLTIGSEPGDGFLSSLDTDGEVFLGNYSDNTLTVNAVLENNGTATSLVKNGPGAVAINGATPYAGATVVNEGSLTFRGHAYPQALAGVISGVGGLVKSGTNLLHLLAASTYAGPTLIEQGIVRVNQNTAFGSSAAGTFIADGATLDLGCTPDVGGTRPKDGLNMQSELITVQGAGVSGQGAIINNSTGQQSSAVGHLTLAGNTTVSANSRWDLRSGTFTMNDFCLTKIGTNMLALTYEAVDPGSAGTAQVDVQEGSLRIQVSSKLNGSAANTIRLRGGAALELYRVDNAQGWGVVCESNSTFNIAVESNASTQNRWTGPVTLDGAVTLTGGSSGSHVGDLQGAVSGSGPLTKSGSATVTISGTNNTYTGETRITGGRLVVTSLRNIGEPCSLGQPPAENAAIKIGLTTSTYSLEYAGAGDTSDRPIDLAGTTAGANIYHNGTGPLKLTGALAASGSGSKTLTLRGDASVPAEFAGVIANAGGNAISVYKQDAGEWLLSGNNTYSGSTRVYNGAMTAAGDNALPGSLYVYGGTLTFTGTNTCPGSVNVYGGTLHIAGTNAFTGAQTVNGGTLAYSGANAQGAGSITLGGGTTSNGVMRILPGASITGTGAFQIGNGASSAGALYVTGGTCVRTPGDAGSNFSFGRGQGSYGYLNMSGGLVSNTRFQVGGLDTSTASGMGIARITGGILSFHKWLLLGRNVGSVGVLTLDGGEIQHIVDSDKRNLALGYDGGRAELNITGGLLNSPGSSVSVRQYNAGIATGIVNLCAGTLAADTITNRPGVGYAYVNFSGGTLKACASSTVFLSSVLTAVNLYGPFGTYAGGAVIDTDGKDVTVSAPLRAPSGNGVYAITLSDKGSGYIGEPYVAIDGNGGSATAVANMEDDGNGTYRVASITVTAPGWDYTAAPSVTFSGGGNGAVAPAVDAVTLAPNTSGGLTKLGAGTLTLSAANAYTGATTVAGGTLKLAHAQALPTQTQVVLAGGALDLNGYTVTNTFSGSGIITNGTVQTALSPSGAGVVGTNTLSLSGVTLQGAYIADVTADGGSDLVAVTGAIDLAGLSLTLVNPGLLNRHSHYTLLTYTGTRAGKMTATNLPDSRWHLVYLADGTVKLIFVEGTLIKLL
jgi:autotransporter-associated beta strand protein